MKKAFSLSEVLITLVIIGVVAAMTIPQIIANSQEQERISRVKKMYSTLKNAMTFIKADGGDVEYVLEQGNNSDAMIKWVNNYLSTRLNIIKICNEQAGCWNDSYVKAYSGNKFTALGSNDSTGLGAYNVSMVLNDGTLLSIDDYSSTQITNILGVDLESSSIAMYFDINGSKKPNTLGKDVFIVVYDTKRGVVPAYADRNNAQIENDCSSSGNGISCIMKYLNK